jgi:penicillin amidase
VTANNRVTPAGYPFFVTSDWSPPYRAARIVELLTASDRLTVDDFARIQADQRSAQAQEMLPFLLQVVPDPGKPEQAQALARLREWDGVASTGSVPATIYAAWFVEVHAALLDNKVGSGVGDVGRHSNPEFLAAVFAAPDSPWCDDALTPESETCQETARVALQRALEYLAKHYGKSMDGWQWGKLHQTQFSHNPFSEVPFLRPLFHRAAPRGGDAFTVNPAPFSLARPFDSRAVPSYRQIIDLADFDNSRFMHTTGQSGHFLSPHYSDFIAEWNATRYIPMYWSRDRLEGSAGISRLRLVPAAAGL